MTHLAWWELPVLLLILSIYFMYRASQDFHDIGSALAIPICWLVALSVIVGHYL